MSYPEHLTLFGRWLYDRVPRYRDTFASGQFAEYGDGFVGLMSLRRGLWFGYTCDWYTYTFVCRGDVVTFARRHIIHLWLFRIVWEREVY